METLEKRTAGSVIVQSGECKTCAWPDEFRKRLEADPSYVPYGGPKPCMKEKGYRKGCAGYLPKE